MRGGAGGGDVEREGIFLLRLVFWAGEGKSGSSGELRVSLSLGGGGAGGLGLYRRWRKEEGISEVGK